MGAPSLKKEEADWAEIRPGLVLEEREKYLKGEGRSYSWEEVKQMAVDKEKRNTL